MLWWAIPLYLRMKLPKLSKSSGCGSVVTMLFICSDFCSLQAPRDCGHIIYLIFFYYVFLYFFFNFILFLICFLFAFSFHSFLFCFYFIFSFIWHLSCIIFTHFIMRLAFANRVYFDVCHAQILKCQRIHWRVSYLSLFSCLFTYFFFVFATEKRFPTGNCTEERRMREREKKGAFTIYCEEWKDKFRTNNKT